MTIKVRIVATLLRVYPVTWRDEYGPELEDILLSRPVGLRTIGDVIWNGLRQRARAAQPATILGLGVMLIIVIGFALNIIAPPAPADSLAVMLRESKKTLPTIVVAPMASDLYVLLLLGGGFWTQLRRGGAPSESGMAAMRLSAIASLPVVLAGILMLTGILGVVVLGPGDVPAAVQPGFTYTHYSAQHLALNPLAVICAPLFKLPESWLWGIVGGYFGRRIRNARRQTATI
jgi:hypothetical protein